MKGGKHDVRCVSDMKVNCGVPAFVFIKIRHCCHFTKVYSLFVVCDIIKLTSESEQGTYSIRNLSRMNMWQSRIEIEYYSVAYFERITEFDVL